MKGSVRQMSWTAPKLTDPLVERAREGDAQALEALLAAVAPAIHRFGARMCRSGADADDVLQDTLIAVATNLKGFEGRSALSSWLFALARSACARRRRGLKNRPHLGTETLESERDETPSPEQRVLDRELGEAIARALEALPEDYREAVLLRDVEGLSAAEAAEAIGVSVEALKSRLHRGRAALHRQLALTTERGGTRGRMAPGADSPATGCPDIVRLWSRKHEGELSKLDCAEIEQHVAGCPSCDAICEELKKALEACRLSATDRVDPGTRERVKRALRSWSSQPKRH